MKKFTIVMLVMFFLLTLTVGVMAVNGSGENLGELKDVIDDSSSLVEIVLYDIFPIIGTFIVILGWLALRREDGKKTLGMTFLIVGGVIVTPRIVDFLIEHFR